MFHNPVVPGFAPDPSVILADGIFYLATSSFHLFPGIPIYASIDLQNWIHIGNAVNRPSQLSLRNATTAAMPLDDGNVMVASGGLFAPTLRYNNGTFYIVCTNCYHGKDNWRTDNFLIHTKDIWSDKWSDPVSFSFYGIDLSLFFDDNDDRVYVQGSWMIDRMKQPSCTIKQFEIDIRTGKPLSDLREIWEGYAKRDTEGPHIYKKDGWYYLLVAEGGTFEHHMLSIARAKNIWGPYESCPHNPIMTADGTDEEIQNVGHGEIFQDANDNWWAMVLGVRKNNGKQPLGRETFLTPVYWPKNGWPSVQQPRMFFSRAHVPTFALQRTKFLKKIRAVHPHVSDLYLHHAPAREPYTSPSSIRLVPTASSLSAPHDASLLMRRQCSPDAAATATLDLNNEQASITAGLTVYKDPLRYASIAVSLATRVVSVHFVDASKGYDLLASHPQPIPSDVAKLDLRVAANPDGYGFAFRGHELERDWIKVGEVDASIVTARDFTGAVMGVFALWTDGAQNDKERGATFYDFEVIQL